MQELMRHSSLRSTLDVCTQAVTPGEACSAGGRDVAGLFFRCEWRGHSLPDRKPLLSHNNEEIGAIEVAEVRHGGAKFCDFDGEIRGSLVFIIWISEKVM